MYMYYLGNKGCVSITNCSVILLFMVGCKKRVIAICNPDLAKCLDYNHLVQFAVASSEVCKLSIM